MPCQVGLLYTQLAAAAHWWGDGVVCMQEQLGGGLHRTLAFTKPDDYRSPWSRMCGGDWEYGIGEHMCVAIACAVRDSNRWQAKCVQQYPDSLKGPGGGAVDPLEVVAK